MARYAWPVGVLVTIAIVALGFLIVEPRGLLNPYSDLLTLHLEMQATLHRSWQAGHGIPLFRSDQLSGEPALTNPEANYTHPLHLLFAVASPRRVVGLVMWLQMLVAAFGAYYAAGVCRLSRPARMMTATATLFSFKAILAVYAGWLVMLAGIAALPWLFGAAAAVVARPTAATALAAAGAGTLALHSGHLQLAYYAVLLLAGWWTWRCARSIAQRDWPYARRLVGWTGAAALAAVAMSAYLLLPIALTAPSATRSVAGLDFVTRQAMPWRGLLTIFNPEFFGTPLDGTFPEAWEYVAYFGGIPTLLAVVGAVCGRSRPFVPALAAGLLVSVVLAVRSPLWALAYALVPGFDLFRLPSRILFVTAFFVFTLAGVGLDVLLGAARTRRSRRVTVVVLVGLVALEGTLWANRYLRTSTPVELPFNAGYLSSLPEGSQPFRIAPLSRSTPTYAMAGPLGLELVTGYTGFNDRRYQTFLDILSSGRPSAPRPTVWVDVPSIARPDLLAALNVRYVVSPKPIDFPADDFVLERFYPDQPQFVFYQGMTTGPVYVYRNARFLQRAFFVDTVTRAADDAAMVDGVLQANVRDTAVTLGAEAGPSTPHPDDSVVVRETGSGSRRIDTHASARRFLVVSEVWNPGWRARVDGRDAALHRTDIALQGLWLDAGDHTIELTFWPVGLTLGLVITGITAAGVCAAGVVLVAGRRRAR